MSTVIFLYDPLYFLASCFYGKTFQVPQSITSIFLDRETEIYYKEIIKCLHSEGCFFVCFFNLRSIVKENLFILA